MENDNSSTTLKVKICGKIESHPQDSRQKFKQSVIDTVLHILRTEDVNIEYIGYKADPIEKQLLHDEVAEYEDCVYVSMNVRGANLNPMEENQQSKEDIVKIFVEVFESKTQRHLEIDSSVVRKSKGQRIIEMSSDWKYYLKHG